MTTGAVDDPSGANLHKNFRVEELLYSVIKRYNWMLQVV